MKIKYLSILLILFSCGSYACKNRVEPEKYPISELEAYDEVLVVEISSTNQSNNSRYTKTESATAKVIQVLKGNLKEGQKVSLRHDTSVPRAVCPVFLKSGYTYLIPLRKQDNQFIYSRFSLIVSDIEPEKFTNYVKQIENGI
ncbi:MAG: hypothetical protein MK185_16550 [Saccharospirillaceae bacterium]|nr:hypothetical protein [Saccharospirillaceae bacterium]